MLTAITLVVLGVLCRLLTPWLHGWNFVPMGALALYAGARLPRRWAWVVPLAAMALSDLVLDHGIERPQLTRWVIYATFAATTFLGPIANRPKFGSWLLPILSLSASTLFWVTSNLSTWAEGLLYPLTLPGLAECFVAAIPFYRNTALADLLGTAVLFGLGPVFERAFGPVNPRPAAASDELASMDPHQAA